MGWNISEYFGFFIFLELGKISQAQKFSRWTIFHMASFSLVKVEKWARAKVYKTVQSYVHMISSLNCTVQLTDTSIANNLKRQLKVTCSHYIAWTEGQGKNREIAIWGPPMWSCFAWGSCENNGNNPSSSVSTLLKNVRKYTPLRIEK